MSRIFQADALEWLGAKRDAAIVVFDPPYRGPTDAPPRGRDDGAGGQVFGSFGFLHKALIASCGALRPGGIVMAFCDFKRVPDVGYLAGMAGLRLSTSIAWIRNRPGTGGIFRSAWDPIMIFGKGNPVYLDRAAIKNWIRAEVPSKRKHPYEKPRELFDLVFGRVLHPGDLVLDPFAGSAASMQPALDLGAEWEGCDVVV